ncbi:hypothetical protein M3Y97_00622300 [Aphelenchoides bicaudatus]|nr:hypothetical protein M3Y97_00622300 [Aphelenchoides bicaudatus]
MVQVQSFWQAKGPKNQAEILIACVIIIVVVSIVGCAVCYFRLFRRDKRKKRSAREIVLENAKVGQKLTQSQAEALYELNESWERFANHIISGNPKKMPKLGRNAHAVLCVDFFRIQKWAKRLREVDENLEKEDLHKVLKRLANELEGHAEIFPLQPETKRELTNIAQLPDKSVTFVTVIAPRDATPVVSP